MQAADRQRFAAVSMMIDDTLSELIRRRPRTLVLTGAGLSAESGIPTFRDAQTGLWSRYSPTELASPEAFESDPERVLDWYDWRRALIARSRPNAGHTAVKRLLDALPGARLVTQNVDGLHQLAGARDAIELHGNIWRLRCAAPGCRHERYWSDRTAPAPRSCPDCGKILRPGVVWFGESLPAQALASAWQLAEVAEFVIVAGTSGLVHPAAALPFHALEQGARVVEINPDRTALSQAAHWHLACSSGTALPALADLLDAP